MNKKITAGLMFILLLTIGAVYVPLPTKAFEGQINFGVIGPVGFPQFQGMQGGAEMAKTEINGQGGILLPAGDWGPAGYYEVVLHYGDEHMLDPLASRYEMARLIEEEECQFVIGGFSTDAVGAMRDEAAAHATDPAYERPIYVIAGAATNELIDCGDGTCGACVRCNYDLYKYTFRVTPNSTILFATTLYAVAETIAKLKAIYGGDTVDTAIICESLSWAVLMRAALAAYLPMCGANIVYNPDTVDPYANNYADIITAIKDAHARLVIHVFSSEGGRTFVRQCHPTQLNVNATLVGIDLYSQMSSTWDLPTPDAGLCKYEVFLAASGTGTPIVPGVTDVFWKNFVGNYSVWPMYTAFGVYDAIYTLKEAVERAGTIDIDAVAAELEQTDRVSTLGRFKFTEYHDVFVNETGSTWTQGFVRPLVVQWQDGVLEVVWPQDQLYSRPMWVPYYPVEDVNLDGEVDVWDAVRVGTASGTYPGHVGWNPAVDIMKDDFIDWFDVWMVERRYGWMYPEEPSAQAVVWNLSIPFKNVNYDVTVFTGYIVYSNYTFDWMEILSSKLVGYCDDGWRIRELDTRGSGQISFDVTSEIDGFCNVTIPKELMFGDFTVLLDDVATAFILTENEDYTSIYFESTQYSFNVKIIGETETRIPGDINGDGVVNILDAIILAGHFGEKG